MAVIMKNMRRSASERDAEDTSGGMPGGGSSPDGAPPERDDVELRLEHHHLEKIGLMPLAHGTKVEFGGHGEVADTGTTEGYSDGEPRHHMTIRLRRAGVDQTDTRSDRRSDLKGDLTKAVEAAAEKDEAAGGRAETKIAEKPEGKVA